MPICHALSYLTGDIVHSAVTVCKKVIQSILQQRAQLYQDEKSEHTLTRGHICAISPMCVCVCVCVCVCEHLQNTGTVESIQ